MKLRRTLSTLSLVFVMYFNTSGGPHTTETLVAKVGPGLALLILLLIPLFWSLPETLIVGELASMLPEEGGYYRWVERAFGRFWAFQNGWWTWLYSLVDMAIYPALFLQYLHFFAPALGVRDGRLIQVLVIWVATLLNVRGALRVGWMSVLSGGFIIITYVLVAIFSLPHITHVPWLPFAKTGTGTLGGLGVGLSIALWNFIGWDNASTVQGEVVDASRTYPRALAFALPLVTINYFIALLPTLGATDWRTWVDGGWPQIAAAATGRAAPVLSVLVATTGMVSAVALFNALLMSYSRIPLAMASDGLLPSFLERTDDRGNPQNAVLVSAICYSACTIFPFAGLVVADVLLYSMALFLEFGALVMLRRREPELRGAYRIPVNTWGVVGLALLPFAVLLLVVALEIHDGEYGAPAVRGALIVAAIGPLLYFIASRKSRIERAG
ncbi:MAG: APC family permease [Gemmatimonadota bacterium]|nr:APC family permease [Gemmatimonadota bacterium]